MLDILSFSGIELLGFILILGGAILIEENAHYFDKVFGE